MLKNTFYYFLFFIFSIGKIYSQSVQVTFSLPRENHFCVNTGLINLPQGNPVGGIYSGIGVIGNTFDTNLLPGTYEIQYQYTVKETGVVILESDKLSLLKCVSLNNTENLNNINIYPNETTNLWIVENALGLSYEVVTPLGLIVHQGSFICTKQVVDMHKKPTGLLYFILKDKNGKVEKRKIFSLN
jgi:hypothetical protein